MAVKYHISPTTGTPSLCRAEKRSCPLGGDSEHYPSADDARKAYELQQELSTVPTVASKQAEAAEAKAFSARSVLSEHFSQIKPVDAPVLTDEERASARAEVADLSLEDRGRLLEDASIEVAKNLQALLPYDGGAPALKRFNVEAEHLDSYLESRRRYTLVSEAAGEFLVAEEQYGTLERRVTPLRGGLEANVKRSEEQLTTVKALVAAYRDEVSIKAVAKATGVSTGSVREQLYFELKQAAKLDSYHPGLPAVQAQAAATASDKNPTRLAPMAVAQTSKRSAQAVNAVGATIASYALAYYPHR